MQWEKSLQFLALFFLEARIPKSAMLVYCHKDPTSDSPAMPEEEKAGSWAYPKSELCHRILLLNLTLKNKCIGFQLENNISLFFVSALP